MYILSQSKEQLVNNKNILAIEIKNNFFIIARCVTNGIYTLAEYKSKERAKQVFEEIMKQIESTEIFVMPEE